jgi:hypothetical protein
MNLHLALCLLLNWQIPISASVIISEIAGKGSSSVCGGLNDWVELYNNAQTPLDISGYILHDDKGINDALNFTFPQDYEPLQPGEYRLICTKDGDDTTQSPQFSIGGDDTITLVSRDGSTAVASVGPLPDSHDEFDVTYAWDSDSNTLSFTSIDRPSETQNVSSYMGYNYYYTSTPTPGLPNILTQVGETSEKIKQRLANQNEMGTRFFGMDSRGFPVDDAFDQVLEFHVTMNENDYQYIMENKQFEVYVPFQTARLVTAARSSTLEKRQELLAITTPGNIRTKGQTSLFFSTCMNTSTVPFQLEFNPLESLFGIEKMYLRNHLLDPTFMRDWAMNRMLARFGLPHIRARKLRFFINGDLVGFYTAMEAMDQEYVFARSFPNYNPFNYSLYKWQIDAIGCGRYDPDVLADAAVRLNETLSGGTPKPYSFEPGPHRAPPPVYGKAGFVLCMEAFVNYHYNQDKRDVATLYLKYEEDCGEMLVEEGLMDRKLGTKNWDEGMKDYIRKFLTKKVVDASKLKMSSLNGRGTVETQLTCLCSASCTGSTMDQEVDLESYLKTTALLAVTISQDSPLGSLNNYYMAQTGDGQGYKLIAYDHNNGPGNSCDCGENNERMLHWSIARPTCLGLEFNSVVGPLLLKPALHARYIEYVRDFVEQVAGAPDLLEEINNHARAIYPFVRDDFWYIGGNYPIQFSTNPNDWQGNIRQPLIPFLLGRVEDVREQLQAMDEGTFPRSPHQANKEAIYEECVDWRSNQPPAVACYNDCLYDGCYENYWQVSHQCIAETGTCIHGTYDIDCRGIREGEQYPGMESVRESTGLATFCLNPNGLYPIKASICPDPPNTMNG